MGRTSPGIKLVALQSVWDCPKNFYAKNVIFLGLKSVILLSKMAERALDSLKYILIWELPIAIYEDIIKVDCSPVFPERSYMRSKKRKKRKKENTALALIPLL